MTKTNSSVQERSKKGVQKKKRTKILIISKQMIGSGASGQVYKTNNPEIFAKVVPMKKLELIIRETYFNHQLQGDSICNLIQSQRKGNEMILYFQNGGQSLKKCNLNVFDKPIVLNKIALAYKSFYKKGIAHRDLKPENIVMDKDKRVKIIDLGLCQLAKQRYGTEGYMPREQYQRNWSNNDIYAYGQIIIYIMGVDINEKLTQLAQKCMSSLESRCSWDQIFEFWEQYIFEQQQ